MLPPCLVVALVVGGPNLGGEVEAAGDGVVVGDDEGDEGQAVGERDHVAGEAHVPHKALLLGQQPDDALLVVATWRLDPATPLAYRSQS